MNDETQLTQALHAAFEPLTEILCGPFLLESYPGGGDTQEACVALLAQEDGALVVRASAFDSHLHNTAVADNEQTWALGDVIEFFVQAAGRDDYYEFHVTPSGIRLQLHLDHYLRLRDSTFESKIRDCGLRVRSRTDGSVWSSEMRIPLSEMGFQTLDGLRFAVCRYNYGTSGEPVLSSFPVLDDSHGFHNPPAWHVL